MTAQPSRLAPRPSFVAVTRCWICGASGLIVFHECRLDYARYAAQDAELAALTGEPVRLVRCRACGFAQPDKLPALPRFFDRMYDQRWSEEWIDQEFAAGYKDFIFSTVLAGLDRRVGRSGRVLLDIGAHAGRFMWLAQRAGWVVEGVELNRRTAACAARRTGRPVHHADVRTLVLDGRRYGAVTLIDVLEHLPDPAPVLARLATLLAPGGWLVVKVPCGPSQWWKERVLAALVGGRDVSLADNLVHVSHFSPRSLASALGRAGFEAVRVETAPPELLPLGGAAVARRLSNGVRLAVYAAGRLPGAIRTPLALHLLAYGRRPLS